MSAERKTGTDSTARRRAARWQLYAAITGPAMAMTANLGAGNVALLHEPGMLLATGAAAVPATQSGAPVIAAAGIVPADSKTVLIQPGEWISIYGTNLASGTATWQGDFPTLLGGTSVTINGRPAFLSFVSPGQINLQAPDDTATGTVPVTVTTAAGMGTSVTVLAAASPSFLLLDSTHVTAIILRSDGSGAYGEGAYDILGPTGNCFGYYTVAANPGDVVELYGVGFGPTTPFVPAGAPFSGSAPINGALSLTINNVPVQAAYAGLSSAGLYQINLVIPPGLGSGDVSIQAGIGERLTQSGLLFSLAGSTGTTPVCVYSGDGDGGVVYGDGGDGGIVTGDGGDGGYGFGDGGGDGGYGFGDGGDGDGDGGDGGDGS